VRIAIVNTHYYPEDIGGAERSLRFLAESLVAEGHECAVFCVGSSPRFMQLNGVQLTSIASGECSAKGIDTGKGVRKGLWHLRDTYDSRSAEKIARHVARFKPDLVNTNNLLGISAALWRKLHDMGIPIVHTLRDYYLMCPNTAFFRNGRPCRDRCNSCRILGLPRLVATRYVRCVVGNSHFILNRHLQAGAFAKATCEVIYNAYTPGAPVEARRHSKVGQLTFGYIGRLAPSKGIRLLLESLQSVLILHPGTVSLRVAGEGDPDYVAELREAATGLPVQFLGRMAPAEFYDSVDVTVVPSLWEEPLARVIFESFAHGVPVLASNLGGSPEIILPGATGWLFDPRQPASLHHAMVDAANQLSGLQYSGYSQRCIESAQAFSPEKLVTNYLRAFRSVLSQRPAAVAVNP